MLFEARHVSKRAHHRPLQISQNFRETRAFLQLWVVEWGMPISRGVSGQKSLMIGGSYFGFRFRV